MRAQTHTHRQAHVYTYRLQSRKRPRLYEPSEEQVGKGGDATAMFIYQARNTLLVIDSKTTYMGKHIYACR